MSLYIKNIKKANANTNFIDTNIIDVNSSFAYKNQHKNEIHIKKRRQSILYMIDRTHPAASTEHSINNRQDISYGVDKTHLITSIEHNFLKEPTMTKISQLPGRIRYEENLLRGNHNRCLDVKKKINLLAGVQTVEVNYRTGRVLILFDTAKNNTSKLEQELLNILKNQCSSNCEVLKRVSRDHKETTSEWNEFYGNTLVKLVSQLVLPSPFNKLVPVVYKGIFH